MQVASANRIVKANSERSSGGGRRGWVAARAVGAIMKMKTKAETPPGGSNTRAASGEERGRGASVSEHLQFYASSSGGGGKLGAAGGGKGRRQNKSRAHKPNTPSRLKPATASAGVPEDDSFPTATEYGGGDDSGAGQEEPVASCKNNRVSIAF